MTSPGPSVLVRLYGGVANLIAPLALRGAVAKLKAQEVDPKRFQERKGKAALPRPEGVLVWFHAASVGESLSVLRLIEHLGVVHPELHFLITSGTATSAIPFNAARGDIKCRSRRSRPAPLPTASIFSAC